MLTADFEGSAGVRFLAGASPARLTPSMEDLLRALLFAFLLALATVVPAFADGDGGFSPPAPVVDIGAASTWGQ